MLRLACISILSPYTIAIRMYSCFLHGILVRQRFHLNKGYTSPTALRPAEIRAVHVSTAKFVHCQSVLFLKIKAYRLKKQTLTSGRISILIEVIRVIMLHYWLTTSQCAFIFLFQHRFYRWVTIAFWNNRFSSRKSSIWASTSHSKIESRMPHLKSLP